MREHHLPELLALWVHALREKLETRQFAGLVSESGESRLVATLLRGDLQGLLLLEVECRAAGLDVILRVSPRTVQKHLVRILAKLSVETRTGAAHIALQMLSDYQVS